ncbi:2-octaprenyl-3-methyl-6-methoxy-1,4-benzoquinol hydroxylase [plant metagenome]|uniref:2-octaprenyl-3-methyl-6-methoxy-1,4-benzoquinol hydroxylase n=1 Tax=plant metagenome TaxID=1297885 RepID=A0A484PRF5_9ZZZZ
MSQSDIVVCGSGIVGLACALALARRGQSVSLLGPRVPVPPAGALYHPRVYAISAASQRFLAGLGVWDSLPAARMAEVQAMDVRGDAGGQVVLHAWQGTRAQLAWIMESGEIERVLAQAVQIYGIPWRDERCVGVENGELLTESGVRLRPALTVAADGAQSRLRGAAGVAVRSRSYEAVGLVTHLDAQRPHGGTAYQWFREDGVLALLPMPDTEQGPQVSMVWSMKTPLARALQGLPAEAQTQALIEKLGAATGGVLGALRPRQPMHGFDLTLATTDMIGERFALVGDAAHRLHPLAGQGLNLGLSDVEALVQAVAGRESYRSAGDPQVLRRYRRARAEPVFAMKFATDGLHRLFDTPAAPVAWLRNTGMQVIERLPFVKRQLIARASES